MAIQIEFRCDHCDRGVQAWDDGNPYYLDDDGTKRYAYHPDHELLERCIGNDVPHLCLACAADFVVDDRAARETCPACRSPNIVDLLQLNGRRCPWCRQGELRLQDGHTAIS